MPYIHAYFHIVWSTKNRTPYLNTPEVRFQVWQHILENGRKKDIFIDVVVGYSDHCHCLISLGTNQTLKQIAHLLNGESSHWINQNKLSKSRFTWQKEYFAIAVSKSILPQVREYIKRQEKHHQTRTFQEEYDQLMKQYDFSE